MGKYFRQLKETDNAFLNLLKVVDYMTLEQVNIFFKSFSDYNDMRIHNFLKAKEGEGRIIISEDGRLVKYKHFKKEIEYPNLTTVKLVYIMFDYIRTIKDTGSILLNNGILNLISEGEEYSFIYIGLENMENSLNYHSKKYQMVREKLLSTGLYDTSSEVVKNIDGTYIFVFDSSVNQEIAENVLNTFCSDIPYNAIFLRSDDIFEPLEYDIVDNDDALANAI